MPEIAPHRRVFPVESALDEAALSAPKVKPPDKIVEQAQRRPNPPVESYGGASLPNRESRTEFASETLGDAAFDSRYTPTALDKLVDFLAALLKKLEAFLVGRLSARYARRRYKLKRLIPAVDRSAEPTFSPLSSAEILRGERIKWQERKRREYNG